MTRSPVFIILGLYLMTSRLLPFLTILTFACACTCGTGKLGRRADTALTDRPSCTLGNDWQADAAQQGLRPDIVSHGMTENMGQQGRSVLLFDSRDWDFGTVQETGGKVSHTFTFTNAGTSSVTVNSAVSSCRCATPSFSRKALQPGERGEITVTFDPEGITDTFTKSIRVISSSGQDILRIRGKISLARNIGEEYPYRMGESLSADRLALQFGQIQHGDNDIRREIRLFNPTGKVIRLSCRLAGRSGCVSVSAPSFVSPETSVSIMVIVSPQAGFYGTLTDRIVISADGEQYPEIKLYGIVTDDMRGVSVETAPRMRCTPAYFNLSELPAKGTARRRTIIVNDGSEDLIIRKIECPTGITSSMDGTRTLKSGEQLEVIFDVDLMAMGNIPDAKVKFVTNDALQPVHIVIFEKSRTE